jgi:RNA 3'-terminal phosphate cyclase (ATP)
METVYVDGSQGEGGGQILRTSLALACITGKTLHIENIRAARRNPGLARQHVSCVNAARQICEGRCEGAALSSQSLHFQPGSVRGGEFTFDIGSAGSASLVIQTVLPALFLAGGPSTITVTGGTHNPWAPPFDFLSETFAPAIANAGFEARCELHKHGFFPAGGGKIVLHVRPWKSGADRAINLCEPCGQRQIHARIYTARLPEHIAERQRKLLLHSGLNLKHVEHIEVTDSDGPGNCVMLRLVATSGGSLKAEGFGDGGPRTTVFTAFGQRGKPSEKVVGEVTDMARDFLESGAAVDHFLADQLVLYMAIATARLGGQKPGPSLRSGRLRAHASGGVLGGCCTTNELSTHLTTNIETIKKFLPVSFTTEAQGRLYRVGCTGSEQQ